jgi:glycerol-3-phosphate acyltransferase PlsX
MRVALDAMGGSLAPEAVVASALHALRADKSLRITLVGEPDRLQPSLVDLGKLRDRVQIHASSQVISADENPTQAFRAKPDASIARCWQLLAEKKVEALVTPSPAPAVVAAGLRLRRFLPHVRRPALAAMLPTAGSVCVLIDAGAQVQLRAAHLYQFAVLGVLFSRWALRVERPRLGLLASADSRPGSSLLREAQKLIEASPLQSRLIGPIDVSALFQGEADVAVCEGVTGELTTDTCETVSEFLAELPGWSSPGSVLQRPRPLLGVDGICVIVPAQAGECAIGESLVLAARIAEADLNREIAHELETGPLAGVVVED